MKQTIATALLILALFPCLSHAAVQPQAEQTYHFDFKSLHGDSFSYETKSQSHDDAFKKAADACFNHFKSGRHISMDEGQDIIDICVNPKKF